MKKALIVGGGTGGHVMPAIVVAKYLKEKGYELKWIGSLKGKNIENKIIRQYFQDIKIFHIPSGKLRRCKNLFCTIFNINNILDIFQFFAGIFVSIIIILLEKPKFIFSKGGFVSVPVAIASKIAHIPFYTHESDYTIGLANKINFYLSSRFFYSFKDTIKQIKPSKAVFSSNPVREEFYHNLDENDNLEKVYELDNNIKKFLQNIDKNKPLILILGGSLGSSRINNLIFQILPSLCERFNVIHQTGEAKNLKFINPSYLQTSFIYKGVSFCMKKSDLIISRAGANLVFEIVASKTPAIFIPLKAASRGEQVNNAEYFAKRSRKYSVLDEDKLNSQILLNEILRIISTNYKINCDEFETNNEISLMDMEELCNRAEKIIVDCIEKDIFK
ncbi:MAG: UDP-N-acetylglucosamine--N-acetylmuramyl-(pentapeptide) pyrophosphoryl-undecaprenol N-acetylglucosamine transferase [Exilispira sp.]